MAVAIVADSSCELSAAQAADAGIVLVPVIVCVGERRFHDGVDLSTADFYRLLASGQDVPSTLPPEPSVFEDAFRRLAGSDVVCLTVSAKISKIYEHALKAAAAAGPQVRVVDTCTLSGGFALLATAAAQLARSGASAETIVAAIETWKSKQQGFAAYPDLRFLARSGRINKAQMALGLMMNVFPITRVSRTGEMEGETTVRSWDQAKESLASIAARKIEHPQATRIAVTHTNAPDLANFIAEGIRQRLSAPPRELSIYTAGPTVGANVGPGAAGVFFTEE
ncbi:MAG TPA: DegV family protein [Candidatus Baltobacteraceae bacterium]|nr:DegV family protein [Candidatus Baltobacteraceae bacterium]